MTWAEIVVEIKKIAGYTQRTGKSEVDTANMVINNAIYEHLKANSGLITDTAVTDPTASASIVAALKGLLKQLQGTGSGGTPITIARGTTTTVHNSIGPLVTTGVSTSGSPIVTGLTGHAFKAGDVVTVDKGFASGSQTVLTVTSTTVTVGNNSNGNTTGLTMALTSSIGAEIDCTGGNALSVHAEITGTGSWTFILMGSPTSGGTFIAQEVNWVPVTRVALIASAGIVFPAHEKYNKVMATQVSGTSSLTLKATPLIMEM